jgi:hypothetical protein
MKLADLKKIQANEACIFGVSTDGEVYTFQWETCDDKRGYWGVDELFGAEDAELEGLEKKDLQDLQWSISMISQIQSEADGFEKGWINAIWNRERRNGEGFPFFENEEDFSNDPQAWGHWQGEVEFWFSHESLRVYKHKDGVVLVGDVDGDWGILIPGF